MNGMWKILISCTFLSLLPAVGHAQAYHDDFQQQPSIIQSVTMAGGPIASKHFQAGGNNFRERHVLLTMRVATNGYGNWGIYFLNPNSVNDTSFGAGYVTNPYTIPMGPTQLELSGVVGLVTGYQDYPLPLLAGDVRLAFYEHGPWNAGLEMAITPYIAEDPATGDTKFGIVATTPILSVRYKFN